MDKLFGKIKMTWLKVIIFAVAAGVYTGAVMLIPALKNTSFQDIGVAFEWWVVFAVIIVVNCEKSTEAMLKCFVFFLISQPLVYLVEIIFGSMTFDLAWMYYSGMWLKMTFLTLPGGFIAYYCKKQNLLGSVILGLGNTIEGMMAFYYLICALRNFPSHILSALFSAAAIFVMSFCIQKQNKFRWLSIAMGFILGPVAAYVTNVI